MSDAPSLVTLVATLTLIACGAGKPSTHSPETAASSAAAGGGAGAPPAVVAGASAGPALAPAKVQELCRNFTAPEFQRQLVDARTQDTDIARAFAGVGATPPTTSCQAAANALPDVIEVRYLAAASLCDLKFRDDGVTSSRFKEQVARARTEMHAAFDSAQKAKTDPDCRRDLTIAQTRFVELQRLANRVCSPEIVCEEPLKTTCDALARGTSPVPGVEAVSKCLDEAEPPP
jgi:hypothetical protein